MRPVKFSRSILLVGPHIRLAVLLAVSVLAAGGCYPRPYTHRFSGRVLDEDGAPLSNASVVNVVHKNCRNAGGGAGHDVRRSVTLTDPGGRYTDRISGVSLMNFGPVFVCDEYSFSSLACKAGFLPQHVADGATETRLSPGKWNPWGGLPPECSQDCVTARHPLINVRLWRDRLRLNPQIQDPGGESCPYPDMPVVKMQNPPTGGQFWIVVTERIDPENHASVEAKKVDGLTFWHTKNYQASEGQTTIYVFALGRKSVGARPLLEGLDPRVYANCLDQEPVGGVQWTVKVINGRRIGGPIELTPVTKQDWARFHDVFVSLMRSKPNYSNWMLFDPPPDPPPNPPL